ncbi:MAG: 50S ribosomal protein L10 [Candidatus Omnitrophota bacterium]
MEEKHGISTKKLMLKELEEKFSSCPNFMLTNYKGLSSSAVESLRKELRKSSSRYYVVKNSIARIAVKQLGIKDIDQLIQGEVGIGFMGDVIKASKTVVDFSKEHKALNLSGAVIDGRLQGVDRIKHFATLPSKEVLLGMVLTYIKSPITGFVGVLGGLLRSLVYAINEIKNAKAQSGDTEAQKTDEAKAHKTDDAEAQKDDIKETGSADAPKEGTEPKDKEADPQKNEAKPQDEGTNTQK